MDPITIAIAAAAAYFLLLKPKKDIDLTDLSAGSAGGSTTSKPSIPGAPTLIIDKINKFLNTDYVKYTVQADGQVIEGKHKAKDEIPSQNKVGSFMVVAQTDPRIRPGQKDPDVIMVVVKDKNNQTVIAKRILTNDKKIIDIV